MPSRESNGKKARKEDHPCGSGGAWKRGPQRGDEMKEAKIVILGVRIQQAPETKLFQQAPGKKEKVDGEMAGGKTSNVKEKKSKKKNKTPAVRRTNAKAWRAYWAMKKKGGGGEISERGKGTVTEGLEQNEEEKKSGDPKGQGFRGGAHKDILNPIVGKVKGLPLEIEVLGETKKK